MVDGCRDDILTGQNLAFVCIPHCSFRGSVEDEVPDGGIINLSVHARDVFLRASQTKACYSDLDESTRVRAIEHRPTAVTYASVPPFSTSRNHERRIESLDVSIVDIRRPRVRYNRHHCFAHALRKFFRWRIFCCRTPASHDQVAPWGLEPILVFRSDSDWLDPGHRLVELEYSGVISETCFTSVIARMLEKLGNLAYFTLVTIEYRTSHSSTNGLRGFAL